MKTQKMNSIKGLTTVVLIAIVFIFASCGNEVQSSAQDKMQQTTKQVEHKAPSIDIHTAAFMGNVKAVKQHILAGTDLNKKDQYGSTPLIIAATFGKTKIAEDLIKGGADLHIKNNDGSTPLHIAAFFCRVEIVKALLGKDADKSIKNSFGSTALESVLSPFAKVKGIYEQIGKDLGPLGLRFDYKHLEKTRPVIAEMLK